jgi:hypothetical protein
MREISQMTEDLDVAMKAHAVKAVGTTRAAADQMVAAAERQSTPMYGVTVNAHAVHTEKKSTVYARITSTKGGMGKVHGGEKAIAQRVKNSVEAVAQTEGLQASE